MKSKASKRPAKKKPVKKAAPKAPAKKALPVENQEKQAETKQPEAKDGSDRVHTKGGKVVDVVKQDTLKQKTEKPVSSSTVSVKSQKTPKADTKPVERQQKQVKTVERSRKNTYEVKDSKEGQKTADQENTNDSNSLQDCVKKELSSVKRRHTNGKGKSTSDEAVKERQSTFLKHLSTPANNYNITKCCMLTGVSRVSFYTWRDKDPEFKEQYDAVLESRIDEWEENLHRNIKSGDTTAVIFALKTVGKERGYVERDTVNKKVASLLEDVLADKITAREAAFKINAMGQPLPEVLKLELAKAPAEDPNAGEGVSVEELERKAKAAMEAVMQQRDHFVPERREEVKEIKDRLKDQETFGEDQE